MVFGPGLVSPNMLSRLFWSGRLDPVKNWPRKHGTQHLVFGPGLVSPNMLSRLFWSGRLDPVKDWPRKHGTQHLGIRLGLVSPNMLSLLFWSLGSQHLETGRESMPPGTSCNRCMIT